MTIRLPQRRPLPFPSAAAAAQKSTAPANADRFGIELRAAREQRLALRRASLAVHAHTAAPSFPATAAPDQRCSRWPQRSIESWNRAVPAVLRRAESELPTLRN